MDIGNTLLTESTNFQLMAYWAIQLPSNKGPPKKLQTECMYLSNYIYTAVNLSDFWSNTNVFLTPAELWRQNVPLKSVLTYFYTHLPCVVLV